MVVFRMNPCVGSDGSLTGLSGFGIENGVRISVAPDPTMPEVREIELASLTSFDEFDPAAVNISFTDDGRYVEFQAQKILTARPEPEARAARVEAFFRRPTHRAHDRLRALV